MNTHHAMSLSTILSALTLAVVLALAASAAPNSLAVAGLVPDAITPDGGRYFGPLVDGKLHGEGRLEWEDGAVYNGGFANGMMSGKGRLTDLDGEYRGEFRLGRQWGEGELDRRDGALYRGGFVRGRMEGKGRFVSARGEVYEGDFVKDAFSGEGVYTAKDGSRHVGRFVDWNPRGPGRYTDAQGNVYEGNIDGSGLTGAGRKTEKDGSVYEGEFRQWLYHGKGTLRDANGDRYEGQFANGLFHGQGTLTYAAAKPDGRTRDVGPWRWGSLVDDEAQQQARLNVEIALYNQRRLLDKALADLAPRDPSKINLYLLAVAGDGSQEVFHREARFVRELFDRRFETGGRSLALINSRNTVEAAPMATLTSLRESLSAIARRMDFEQDILFLFLTSHGSDKHELMLDQRGMDLRALPAAELGAMLREFGFRWKVIVVSACYSGGFIDAVKDERTLVITAARRDRKSFGCADDRDFTYFGKAFFKEALPHSASFAEAFEKAEGLIREWEEKDSKEERAKRKPSYSVPQISNPSPIDRHLKRWWAQIGRGGTVLAGR